MHYEIQKNEDNFKEIFLNEYSRNRAVTINNQSPSIRVKALAVCITHFIPEHFFSPAAVR